MRKNKMMRTAAVLGVATMLTASVLSGTFAKYTTTADSTDSARVAKWGVKITMANDDSIFSSTYAKNSTDAQTSIENTVVAATNDGKQDKVVAPGTSGETTFSISGTPEVAFKLDVAVDDNTENKKAIQVASNTEVSMAAGEFEDSAVKVKTNAVYEPIKFTLSKKDAAQSENYTVVTVGTDAKKAENMSLSELENALKSLSATYEANKTVDATYKISWKWDYETNFTGYATGDGLTNSYKNADILDTYLGNETTAQTEKYKITITATQID